jgi:hypothetical protein
VSHCPRTPGREPARPARPDDSPARGSPSGAAHRRFPARPRPPSRRPFQYHPGKGSRAPNRTRHPDPAEGPTAAAVSVAHLEYSALRMDPVFRLARGTERTGTRTPRRPITQRARRQHRCGTSPATLRRVPDRSQGRIRRPGSMHRGAAGKPAVLETIPSSPRNTTDRLLRDTVGVLLAGAVEDHRRGDPRPLPGATEGRVHGRGAREDRFSDAAGVQGGRGRAGWDLFLEIASPKSCCCPPENGDEEVQIGQERRTDCSEDSRGMSQSGRAGLFSRRGSPAGWSSRPCRTAW